MQRRSLLSALAGLLLASAASASGNGAIEINATTAAGSFPVVISQRGLYRLTSNLDAGGASTTLIEVGAADVTIDLNGFSLSNGLRGIHGFGDNLSVRNGAVHGMTQHGMWIVGAAARVEAVRVSGNGTGIVLWGDGGLILDSIVSGNGSVGISARNGTMRRCVVASNGSSGLEVTSSPSGILLSLEVAESAVLSSGSHAIGVVDGKLVGNLIVGNPGGAVRIYSGQIGATGLARNVFSSNGLGFAWSAGGIATGPNVCSGVAC